MPKRKERDIEKKYSTNEFAGKLRRLADALERGDQFRLQVGGERICVPARAVCSIEHEREGANEEIEFQIKWTNPQERVLKLKNYAGWAKNRKHVLHCPFMVGLLRLPHPA